MHNSNEMIDLNSLVARLNMVEAPRGYRIESTVDIDTKETVYRLLENGGALVHGWLPYVSMYQTIEPYISERENQPVTISPDSNVTSDQGSESRYCIVSTIINTDTCETMHRTFASQSSFDDCSTILQGISDRDKVSRASYGEDYLTLVASSEIRTYRIVADSESVVTSDQGNAKGEYIRVYRLFELSKEAEQRAISDHIEANPVCSDTMARNVSLHVSQGKSFDVAVTMARDFEYRKLGDILQDCGYRFTSDGVRIH